MRGCMHDGCNSTEFRHVQYISQQLMKLQKAGIKYDGGIYVHELLSESSFTYPAVPKHKKTAKQKEVYQKLLAESEDRKYEKMVQNIVESKASRIRTERGEVSSYRDALSIGTNILVTMVTLFVAGWFVCYNAFGGMAGGAIGGVVFAMIGMLAEMGLFVIKSSRHEAAAAKVIINKRKQNRKRLKQTLDQQNLLEEKQKVL
eukprot:TRINITY_DN1928_c0_g1_i1.p1 TRINITY_DN1928_c0_g1~~TRINITY_DN1928_c0_g1_i1.p1  ORF type:complete len:233 (+),score=38.80 TRINITY_DN1928_c0_g1_i1:96-701(+)